MKDQPEPIPYDCPDDERWIYENPEVIRAIRRGVEDVRAGKVTRWTAPQ